MPGTPPVHTITYRSTNHGITNFSTRFNMAISDFAVSGETGVKIGKIVSITIDHAHSCSFNGDYEAVSWLYFGEENIASDYVTTRIRGWTWYHNTFNALPEPEQFARLSAVRVELYPLPANWQNGQLTWQASRDWPILITVSFYAASDMTEGASPPTVSGVQIADSAGHMGTFGNCVQGQSRLTVTGQYKLDPDYIYLSAVHTLRLTSGTSTIYSAAQTDNAVFDVGAISVSGTVNWSYNVLDTAGNSVTRTGSFTVLAYSPPVISGYAIDRYAIDVDDMGDPVYNLANDGAYVWISLKAQVNGVAGKNAWTLTLSYGTDGDDVGKSKQIASGADAGTKTFTDDRSLVSETITPAANWWFRLRLADRFTAVESVVMVGRGAALLNIEEFGTAVGMYSTGRAGAKRFEVGEDYESIFYGGIRGVTNYTDDEVATGGYWIDGKPIFRLCGQVDLKQDMVNNTVITNKITTTNVTSVISFHASWRDTGGNIRMNTFSYGGGTSQDFALTSAGLLCVLVGEAIAPGVLNYVIEYTREQDGIVVRPGSGRIIPGASSVLGGWTAASAFDGSEATGWMCADADAEPWIQMRMDVALRNIKVEVHGCSGTNPHHNPVAGKVLGSNDGASWTELGSYSGWNGTQSGGLLGTVDCGNRQAYSYVRLTVTQKPVAGTWICVGCIRVSGNFEKYVNLPASDPGIEGPQIFGAAGDAAANDESTEEV